MSQNLHNEINFKFCIYIYRMNGLNSGGYLKTSTIQFNEEIKQISLDKYTLKCNNGELS